MFGESAARDVKDIDIVFDLSTDSGVKLADSIPNTSHVLVVSEPLRAVLAKTGDQIEFYPAHILNQKKRIVREPYFVVNPLDFVDCMDRKQSDYDEDTVERGQVQRFRRLVLDVAKIPPDRQIFRLASQKELVLVRKDLAYDIYRVHEFRGMIFQTLESFGEEFR